MRHRYLVLRAFSLILRIAGWVGVVVGLILFVVGLVNMFSSSADYSGVIAARYMMGEGVGLVVAGLISVLYGEIIEVFFDIEANTRRAAEMIERLATAASGAAPPPPPAAAAAAAPAASPAASG